MSGFFTATGIALGLVLPALQSDFLASRHWEFWIPLAVLSAVAVAERSWFSEARGKGFVLVTLLAAAAVLGLQQPHREAVRAHLLRAAAVQAATDPIMLEPAGATAR